MYWPNKQSLKLNLEVANLFIQTHQKFFNRLKNRTKQPLPIDVLNSSKKTHLFLATLIELEIIILDIIELNLKIQSIQEMQDQIFYDLIIKIMKRFIKLKVIDKRFSTIDFGFKFNKLSFCQNTYLYKNLFIYLIFGSNYIKNNTYTFIKTQTPRCHIKILFENFIIQLSNIVLFNILNNNYSKEDSSFLLDNDYRNKREYKSIRDISNFQNNLLSYHWISYYIFYPQNIYCHQYQVWLLSSKGIIFKYIYANRYSEYLKLSTSQMVTVIYLELQDFIIPKINFLIILLGKLILYILLEVISKSIQILLNQIIIRINKYKK